MKFVFDLDGTICFQGQPISEKILRSLCELKENGHEIIFASARPIRDLLPILPYSFHRFRLVGGNGSLVSIKGKTSIVRAFSKEQIRKLLAIIKDHHCTYLIDSEWDYSYTGSKDHPILKNVDPSNLADNQPISSLKTIVKILILSADDMEQVHKKVKDLNVIVSTHKNENVIDISPQNIHKWSALQYLGVKEKEYIAFGNDINDVSMFQHARHSVMIGYHSSLAPYANETIKLTEDVEEEIVMKIQDLEKRRVVLNY